MGYDLVGFGWWIYGTQQDEAALDLADAWRQVTDRRAFIFSTSSDLEPIAKDHVSLNAEDLKRAEEFAQNLRQNARGS